MMTDSQQAKLSQYTAEKSADTAARKRLAALFDDGVYTEIGAGCRTGKDPVGVAAAYGYIEGSPVYAFSQDSSVMSGAVSKAHAAKICKVFELAEKNGVPVVGIYDSCGAYVEDGADALNSYSEILMHTANLSGVVPQVSVIAGVCAGSMAMIACSADFTVMTDSAELYMAVGQADNSSAAAMAEGMVSVCASDDSEAMAAARKYLSMMPSNNLAPVPEFEYAAPSAADFGTAEKAAESLADTGSILEISAGFGTAAYTALCTIGGVTAGIAATNKTAAKLSADDCSKIARFVMMCDAFSVPIVTVVDTEGFELSAADGVRQAAKLSSAYAEATCAKISLISGNAYGAAFVALAGANAGADVTYALPDAVAAPLDPVTAAEFLYHDKLKGAEDLTAARNALAKEYAENEASAFEAAAKGAVDDIVSPEEARNKMISVLDITAGKRLNKRLPKKHSNMPL